MKIQRQVICDLLCKGIGCQEMKAKKLKPVEDPI
jgi:hypothetical protein